jgi:cellulose synthase/poly-beta-1,6-N-acetylglucosamine synthase-like glycosyltransferase
MQRYLYQALPTSDCEQCDEKPSCHQVHVSRALSICEYFLFGLGFGLGCGLTYLVGVGGINVDARRSLLLVSHTPYFTILAFLCAGLIERVGYLFHGRSAVPGGKLPQEVPLVCVQLPMFNEHQVAASIIEAACSMRWPRDRFEVQVLDDSTDIDTRALVDNVVATQRSLGVNCQVLRREKRDGYKAGALESGRKQTDAEFLALFDADFLPTADFLERAITHFYAFDAAPHEDLALVQVQWGHLNHTDSLLTLSQSMWVDDHHTLQMSWRSAQWQFVNFTGTAGVWRARAIQEAGGWRSGSLVEDCELSFRTLFAGFRTTFVKEIVQPAELPGTYTGYKAQQKRWTEGWAQLIVLHLRYLLHGYSCDIWKRCHLVYHMCLSVQWPLWMLWVNLAPVLIYNRLWYHCSQFYLVPPLFFMLFSCVMASLETRHTYEHPDQFSLKQAILRTFRVFPLMAINIAMLPHQACAWISGIVHQNTEFERTPKAGNCKTSLGPASAKHGSASRFYKVKIHWYIYVEVAFVVYQAAWSVYFGNQAYAGLGIWLPCFISGIMAMAVAWLCFLYGDHDPRSHVQNCPSVTHVCAKPLLIQAEASSDPLCSSQAKKTSASLASSREIMCSQHSLRANKSPASLSSSREITFSSDSTRASHERSEVCSYDEEDSVA